MLARIGNTVYDQSRSGSLSLPGFPDFSPIIAALKTNNVTERSKSFRVSAQQHDRLLVLETFAKKWLETDTTSERAKQTIDDHNAEYNPEADGGLFWIQERSSQQVYKNHQKSKKQVSVH